MRSPDQIADLSLIVERHRSAQWERGVRDCGTFAADCMVALGCDDPMVDLRGNYETRIELIRLITSLGHRGIPGFVGDWCQRNGFQEIEPWACQVGDLGLTSTNVLCVRMPDGFIAMAETGGLYLANPTRAWGVKWA